MRMFRVSFLVEEGSLATIISAMGNCATSGLTIAENVPAPPVPTTGARQLELPVKRPPRPLNEARSITFKAVKSVLDMTATGDVILQGQLERVFIERGMKAGSVSPCMTYVIAQGYVTKIAKGRYIKQ